MPVFMYVNKSWLTPTDHETHCVTPSPYRAVHKAGYNRQVMVVGRVLTTLGDNRRAIAKLFLVQRFGKAPEGITPMFGEHKFRGE